MCFIIYIWVCLLRGDSSKLQMSCRCFLFHTVFLALPNLVQLRATLLMLTRTMFTCRS